jgi:hypothetical protein
MAQVSFPWENIDTTETQFGRWADGITGGPGVIPKGNQLAATFTGGAVTVAAGEALVRGAFYESDSPIVHSIAPTSANTRIDLIVLRLDPVANSITQEVLTGTAGVSPVAPTPTQTVGDIYEYPIYRVLVNTFGVTGIVDQRYLFTGFASAQFTKTNTDTSITLATSDRNSIYYVGSSSNTTVTVPDVLIPGERVDFVRIGTGSVTFTAGAGVTFRSADSLVKIQKQWGAVSVLCKSAGEYVLIGLLGA